jgi:hypothetical protein
MPVAGTDPLGIITVIAGGISAISFVVSAICWIRAASIKHPNRIDLGVIGSDEEPEDWFRAYRRATAWNARAAWFAAVGAIGACAVEVIEIVLLLHPH